MSLRDHKWRRFLRGPDSALLEELYVPALSEALRYDRCCAYFSSSVLAAAARGFGRLIERLEAMGGGAPRPAIRLVVNEELTEEDVRALTETGDLARLEATLKRRFRTPKDALELARLAMLAWLVKCGLLEIRVGVMRQGGGIVHAKFGMATDAAGDAVVFSGSGNESAQGLLANYERLEVSGSWHDPERYHEYASEFEALWADRHPDVHTVTLPEALRLELVRFAPPEAPVVEPGQTLARQRAAMLWRFIVESPYLPNGGPTCDATAMVDLWPHQRRVVEETAEAWPDGRLLCDEVGMGKTIEAILVLRRLMAGRGVRRVLILLPAGLLGQWQTELREKGGLEFPWLEGTTTLVWPDGRREKLAGLAQALEQDALLMSRETARTEQNAAFLLQATPWDLVILDEAHAARRRKQEEGEFNSTTLLLGLLRQLQLRRRARGFLLLSATPMQIQPWEPWDLLAVLGVGGRWLADFAGVRDFYTAVAAVESGSCDLPTARGAASLIAADPEFPPPPAGGWRDPEPEKIAQGIVFVPPGRRKDTAHWLRQGSPLARRMHRNTRATLTAYHAMGLLPSPPRRRIIEDELFDYKDPAEREVYDAVGRYIEKRFRELEAERPGKGFVMTIYRRRASSSPFALERSLERRRDGLLRVSGRLAYDPELSRLDIPEDLDPDDLPEGEGGRVSLAFPQDPQTARAELAEVERVLEDLRALRGRDSKRDRFFDVLRRITGDGRPVLVFTEYTDTLEYLRDTLVAHYGQSLGCYSGSGGQIWNGESWQSVTKDRITGKLQKGELQALICTDAASEGLNLQAAGAVINYDLPWNPSKVEQRIGRVDRIDQQFPDVRVVNLFLRDSVDDRVYRALRYRCGLFERFVGAMQPVLARARRMLLGQEPADLGALETTAAQVERDAAARESYVESLAVSGAVDAPAVTRERLQAALADFDGSFGPAVRALRETDTLKVAAPGLPKTVYGTSVRALEANRSARPLSPLDSLLYELAERLSRPGERLPLVIGSFREGGFRRSVAYWVSEGGIVPVDSAAQLLALVAEWSGRYPDPARWVETQKRARKDAEAQVWALAARAAQREREALLRQREAARLRLQRELGRYLVCLGQSTSDLNGVLHQQMQRDIASAARLKNCLDRLGGYPEWPGDLCQELERFAAGLSDNQRRARLLGKEIDAALEDPRWAAELI